MEDVLDQAQHEMGALGPHALQGQRRGDERKRKAQAWPQHGVFLEATRHASPPSQGC